MTDQELAVPSVYTLTTITGRRRNDDRETIVMSFEMRRRTFLLTRLGMLPSSVIGMIAALFIGSYGLLVGAAALGAWSYLVLHQSRPGDVVVLDGVRLVGNIGAVTRSAAAFGAAGVVLVDSGLVSTLDRRLVRASRGLVLALPVVLAGRRETSRALARAGIPVATLSPDAPAPLRAVRDVRRRVALVLGGERRGVDPDRWGRGGLRLTIPMTGDVESLNVSVAAALALYERQAAVAEPARAPVGAAPVDYPR